MRILLPISNLPHAHNYMRDFLFDGFETMGHEVVEFPEAPHLRLPNLEARDACCLDTDQIRGPRRQSDGEILADLATGRFDVIVDADAFTQPKYIAPIAAARPGSTPVVVVDGTDSAKNLRREAEAAWRSPVASYFKRELPIGATWALPCPLTYSRRRAVAPSLARTPTVVYYATMHAGTAWARQEIARGLVERLGSRADVATTEGQSGRPTPEWYHARLATATVGVHWNPTTWPVTDHERQSGWDGNRFWENCAFGVAQVALRPFIQFPGGMEFTDGVDVLWADDPDQVVSRTVALVSDSARAFAIATAAHTLFLTQHASDGRAAYVLRTAGIV